MPDRKVQRSPETFGQCRGGPSTACQSPGCTRLVPQLTLAGQSLERQVAMLRPSCLRTSARASKKCCRKVNVCGGKGGLVLGQEKKRRPILKAIFALWFLVFVF